MDTSNEREALIFLDFQERLPSEVLQDRVFIRVANLDDQNPLIQVNDLMFKGTYDYSIGTNLFFKKCKNADSFDFPFKDPSTYKLEFVDAQTKILRCKQMKIPPTTVELPVNVENIKFNFNWEYRELLKKIENGTLDLQDTLVQSDPKETAQPVSNHLKKETGTDTQHNNNHGHRVITSSNEPQPEIIDISEVKQIRQLNVEQKDELEEAYENLQLLARTPVRRLITHEDAPCDPRFKSSYEFNSIECKILERPLFSYLRTKKSNKSLEDFINIERCATLGLLTPSDEAPRTLTEEEKNRIMKVDNFENLDLTARYSILQSHMEELEKQVNSNTSEQNEMKDEFDRTPIETLQIFKRLLASLRRRIEEIDQSIKESM